MSDFKIIFGEQIKDNHLIDALKLDQMVYKDIYQIDFERCKAFIKRNPEIYIMAVNENDEVVGYINYSPISSEMYDKMLGGEEIDSNITPEDIKAYKPGSDHQIYFSSICVHPDFRKQGVAKTLLTFLKEYEENLEKKGIHISKVVADAVSDSGRNILISNGFKFIKESSHDSTIMEKINE